MADASKVKINNGDVYDLKDAAARAQLAAETTAREAGDAANAAAVEAEASARAAAVEAVRKTAYGAYPTGTASGAIATFSDGADDVPVKALTVAVEPVQAGSGDQSPDNVRPITGWTGATVTRAGKNLLPVSYKRGGESNGVTWTNNNDGSWTANGTATANSYAAGLNCFIFDALPPGTYTATVYSESGEVISSSIAALRVGTGNSNTYLQFGGTFTLDTATVCTLSPMIFKDIAVNNIKMYFQLEKSTSPTGYNTYTGTTCSIAFPTEAGTVYGGTLDVTTGKLTVDRIGLTLTGSEAWTAVGSGNSLFFRLTRDGHCGPDTSKVICSHYPFATIITSTTVTGYYAHTSASDLTHTYIQIRPDLTQINTVAAWKQFLAAQYSAETPVTCVYPLYTPIEVNLTPTEVRTLYGANNIWADTGDVDVTYRADTKLYIDKIIAELQALILEQ